MYIDDSLRDTLDNFATEKHFILNIRKWGWHLPDAKPDFGCILISNFIIKLTVSFSFHLKFNTKKWRKSNLRNHKKLSNWKYHDIWPRLHLRCDRLNVRNSTEKCLLVGVWSVENVVGGENQLILWMCCTSNGKCKVNEWNGNERKRGKISTPMLPVCGRSGVLHHIS